MIAATVSITGSSSGVPARSPEPAGDDPDPHAQNDAEPRMIGPLLHQLSLRLLLFEQPGRQGGRPQHRQQAPDDARQQGQPLLGDQVEVEHHRHAGRHEEQADLREQHVRGRLDPLDVEDLRQQADRQQDHADHVARHVQVQPERNRVAGPQERQQQRKRIDRLFPDHSLPVRGWPPPVFSRSCKDRSSSGNSARHERHQQGAEHNSNTQQNIRDLVVAHQHPHGQNTAPFYRRTATPKRQDFPQSGSSVRAEQNSRRHQEVGDECPGNEQCHNRGQLVAVAREAGDAESQRQRRGQQYYRPYKGPQGTASARAKHEHQGDGRAEHRQNLQCDLAVVHREPFPTNRCQDDACVALRTRPYRIARPGQLTCKYLSASPQSAYVCHAIHLTVAAEEVHVRTLLQKPRVAHPAGHADLVEVVQQGDRVLSARVEDVLEFDALQAAVFLDVGDQLLAGGGDRLGVEVQVLLDPDEPLLLDENSQGPLDLRRA